MQFEELIQNLGKRLGTEIAIEDGSCALGVDDMSVTLMNLPEIESVAFTGEIGNPPPQGLEELYRAMLTANHLFRGTSGSTISYDDEGGKFQLCWISPTVALDGDRFYSALEKFVNTLETWRKLLADYRPSARPAAAEPVAESPSFGAGGFMSV